MFDLTAGVYFNFYNIPVVPYTSASRPSTSCLVVVVRCRLVRSRAMRKPIGLCLCVYHMSRLVLCCCFACCCTTSTFYFSIFHCFIPFYPTYYLGIFLFLFSLPIIDYSSNPDPRLLSRLVSPLATTVRAFIFTARTLPPFIPSSTRAVKFTFYILLSRFVPAPSRWQNVRTRYQVLIT